MVEVIMMECSHFLYKQATRDQAPNLAVIFMHLVKGGNFPVCWKLAHVVLMTKKSSFSDVGDYRPISITTLV